MIQVNKDRYYFVYITTNESKDLINIGIAGDLSVRLYQLEYDLLYKSEKVKNACTLLLYWEKFENVYSALSREKELRKWSKKRKVALINTANPEWKSLNEIIFQHGIAGLG